jgi:5-methylcytosine-specific restriction protein A
VASTAESNAAAQQGNPDWTWDEQILAFDLYLRKGALGRTDPLVVELSELLRSLDIHPQSQRAASFRNANSVARKLVDIRTHHPGYEGKKTSGSRIDREIWVRFGDDTALVDALAARIREGAGSGSGPEDDEVGVEAVHAEGRIVYRMHRQRERSAKLRKQKFAKVAAAGGKLRCEACDVELAAVYGAVGDDVYECHHLVPLHAAGERVSRIADVALLCPTCHRVAHRIVPWPDLEQLRAAVSLPRTATS